MGAKLSVKVRGPVALADIGRSDVEAPEVAVISHVLGQAAVHTGDTGTGSDSTETTLAPTTTTTAASALLHQGTVADLEAGTLEASLTLPAGTPAEPGAYLLEVQLTVGGEVLAGGEAWVGRMADRDVPLDVAFVLPVSLGIHRDTEGAFFDQALEEALASTGPGGGLSGLFATLERFRRWDLTLAIEPILLTQLRDMADGYPGVDSGGAQVQVGKKILGPWKQRQLWRSSRNWPARSVCRSPSVPMPVRTSA